MKPTNTCSWSRAAAATTVIAATMLFTQVASAGRPLVTVSGGGTASFIGNPFFETSQFSVGAVIRDNGRVTGHFTCMIVGVVTISGHVDDFDLNYDGGGNLESVTLRGTAHGPDHFSGEKPFTGCDFEVELFQGGPGTGMFIYSDCVVPPPGDHEIVTNGHIMLTDH